MWLTHILVCSIHSHLKCEDVVDVSGWFAGVKRPVTLYGVVRKELPAPKESDGLTLGYGNGWWGKSEVRGVDGDRGCKNVIGLFLLCVSADAVRDPVRAMDARSMHATTWALMVVVCILMF